jgi:hypothetical protein
MSEVSRRGFVVQASVAGAAAAAATAIPLFADGPASRRSGVLPETLLLHVRDVETSEVAIITEADEVVYRDEQLVNALLHALSRKQGR